MRATELRPFDVCGPLPTGVTVLEASAGTGKTFTIAALAARYVAEGRPLEQLLVVTFTRMATSELRERVRDRLVTAESGLARVVAGGGLEPDDDVLALLAKGSTSELELRRHRLARALADFDAATIATTHGFCQHALSGLGVAADLEAGVTFVDDLGALVDDVVDDLYVRRFRWDGRPPPISRKEALRIGRVAVDNSTALLEPHDAPRESTPAMRRRLAEAVRHEFERRKRQGSILSHDDLLTRLERTLADGATGAAACARLRSRYRVVLVDEFQ
ncbi:MAG: UvrD-helicase domain-containing protein, partial [Acidimicrobiia bacterium]